MYAFICKRCTKSVGWFSCALIKMAILIYAQLDQSTFWAARLTSEDTGRWQYFQMAVFL